MEYNLLEFGKEMKNIRKNLNITQNYIYDTLVIHPDTLRKIENGNHIPLHETLDILSNTYKTDLNSLLLKYKVDDYEYLQVIKKRLESKIDEDDYKSLSVEIQELKKFLGNIHSSYHKNITRQLIVLAKAVILYKEKEDYSKALNSLKEAIKITTPNFKLNNYKSFVYSEMEIRILMNLSFVLNSLGDKEKYKDILEFCIKNMKPSDTLYPKLCHNLSGSYRRSEEYEKSFKYSNLGIQALKKNRNLNGLSLLYYGKGISEFNLGKDSYIESFENAISICEILGQDKLKSKITENCKVFFGIDI